MRAIGIVLAGGNSSRMKELSNKRAIAAMPIAGSFRSIDFTLSNMTNSHIQKVAVFTQYNAKSLNEHLNSSKWWDFGRKREDYMYSPLPLHRRTTTGIAEPLMRSHRTSDSLRVVMSLMLLLHPVMVCTRWTTIKSLSIILQRKQILRLLQLI